MKKLHLEYIVCFQALSSMAFSFSGYSFLEQQNPHISNDGVNSCHLLRIEKGTIFLASDKNCKKYVYLLEY